MNSNVSKAFLGERVSAEVEPKKKSLTYFSLSLPFKDLRFIESYEFIRSFVTTCVGLGSETEVWGEFTLTDDLLKIVISNILHVFIRCDL